MKKLTGLLIFCVLLLCSAARAAVVTATSNGKWSQGNNWSTGNAPSSTDDVVINSNVSIWIDGNFTCKSLTVNGEVYFKLDGESLNITGDLTINSGGAFNENANGNNKVQALSVGGSLYNNGTLALYNSAGVYCTLTFTGSSAASWVMNSSSSTDVAPNGGVVVDKGSSTSSVLTATFNGTFTVAGGTTSGFLQLIDGLFTITGNATTSNPVLGASYNSIPSTAGLRLNSSAFTLSGQTGTLTNSGLLQVSNGTFNAGAASGDLLTGNGRFVLDGGTLQIASRFSSTSGTYTQSAGTLNSCTSGNSTSSAPSFDLQGGSSFTLSGGTINLVQASTATTPLDYQVQSGTLSITGGTLNVGTSATTGSFGFRLAGALPNLVVDNTSNAKTALLSAAATGYGTVTVSTGATLNTNGQTLSARGTTFTNNGSLTGSGIISFSGTGTQSYTGSGSVATNITVANSNGLNLSAGIAFGNSNTLTVASGAQLDAKTYQFSFGTSGNVVVNGTLYTSNSAGFSGTTSTTISSNNSPTISLGSSSTVIYNSTSTQSVTARAYANLTITTAGAKILGGAASIGSGNTLTVSSGSIFDAANNTISFGSGATASIQGTFRTANTLGFSGGASTALSSTNTPSVSLGSSSTVQYNGTGSQTVTARSDYANLTISGARSGGTVTLASGTIGLTGTFTASATSATYVTSGNTFNYKGSGQSIAAFSYNNLDLTGASGTTFPAGTVSVSGSFTPASITSATQGTFNYKGSGQTLAAFTYYNLDLTGASGTLFPTGTVAIAGTFTPASISSASQGTISFSSGSQTVPVFGYNHLALSSGSKTLAGTTSVGGNLTLSGTALLSIGSYNLTISGTASGDASNFIVTNGSGSVVLRNVTASGKLFPIGASSTSYSPLTIAQGSNLDWTVRVGSSISPTATNVSYALQRMWTITPSTNPAPSSATLTFQYNEGDAGIQGSNWSTSGTVALNRYNGTAWTTAATGLTPSGSAGGVRTVSASGFTAFSPWVITKSSSPLPVRFLSFNGQHKASGNLLQWRTATEANNAGFGVERSIDGRNFTEIAFVPTRASGGNSSTDLSYQYTDATAPAQTLFYRLRQQDAVGGQPAYTAVLRLEAGASPEPKVTLAPNPARATVQLQVQVPQRGTATIQLFDAGGRVALQQVQTLEAGAGTLALSLDRLPAGSYLLQVRFADGSNVQTLLVHQ